MFLWARATWRPHVSGQVHFDINADAELRKRFCRVRTERRGRDGRAGQLVGLKNFYAELLLLDFAQCATTVYWAYNGSTAGGSVLTSPVLSLDGTKVAYVESAAGSTVFPRTYVELGQGTSATASAAPTLNGSCVAGTPRASSH